MEDRPTSHKGVTQDATCLAVLSGQHLYGQVGQGQHELITKQALCLGNGQTELRTCQYGTTYAVFYVS